MCARRRKTAATIRDVATLAQVSPMTVSRTLRHPHAVNQETRARVEHAIAQLNYTVPVPTARATAPTQTVACIVPEISNPFFNDIVISIEQAADQHGYRLIICNSQYQPQREARFLSDLHQRNISGIIIAPCADTSLPALQAFAKEHTPLVLIDREVPGFSADIVQIDNVAAALQLTNHLIACGHRRIAFVSGDSTVSTFRDRLQGYRMALDTAGIQFDPALIYSETLSEQAQGARAMQQLLDQAQLPDAVIAINRHTAITIFRTCQQQQIAVPAQLALVAFDDIDATQLFPFFTVMAQPTAAIGQQAVECLLKHMRGRHGRSEPCNHKVAATLVVRQSCGYQAHMQAPTAVGHEQG